MPSSTPSSARATDLLAVHTVAELARAARRLLPRPAWDYFRGGADEERTLAANRRAFARRALCPRVLVDVSRCDPGLELLGERLAFPVLVAPMAVQRLAHPDGELATARAAAALGTLFIASTLASVSLEETAAAAPGAPRWFQLYVHRDRGLTRALVERARAAGYRALVLTVDAPVLGRRLADVRNGFELPPGVGFANLGQGGGFADYVEHRHDAAMTWRDLEWLRDLAGMPLVLKGIVRPDDAVRAVDAGAAALVVSNHGGRQLDGMVAALDALPAVIAAVGGRCPVLVDGGVRWASDVLKARALGAAAVLVGRPVLWGLAVGGEAGVARVLTLFRDELTRALALAGCPDLASVTRDLVAP
jgi:4-hydroxymandelate oxidase